MLSIVLRRFCIVKYAAGGPKWGLRRTEKVKQLNDFIIGNKYTSYVIDWMMEGCLFRKVHNLAIYVV